MKALLNVAGVVPTKKDYIVNQPLLPIPHSVPVSTLSEAFAKGNHSPGEFSILEVPLALNGLLRLEKPVRHVTRSLSCDECNRLSQSWITALSLFTKSISEIQNEQSHSVGQRRQLRGQFENAHLQVRDKWLLLELHRRSNNCVKGGRALHDAVSKASHRRESELSELAQEGMPVIFHSRWHASIGPLHIWPSSGRWSNEWTSTRGKINSDSIRSLLCRELIENVPSMSILNNRAIRPESTSLGQCSRGIRRPAGHLS